MRALLLCLVWIVVGTIAFARQYLDRPGEIGGDLLPAYAEWLTCYLPWGLLSTVILWIERRFPLGRPGWAWHLLVLALVSVPMAYGAWLMTAALGALVDAATGRAPHPMTLGWMPARDLLGHELLFWTAVAGSTALRTLIDARSSSPRRVSIRPAVAGSCWVSTEMFCRLLNKKCGCSRIRSASSSAWRRLVASCAFSSISRAARRSFSRASISVRSAVLPATAVQ